MTAEHTGLPSLDCHAHIAPDVTRSQLATLGNAHVFAVTRSLSEAASVAGRTDRNLTWGLGVHPGVSVARSSYDLEVFRELLPRFALVGEVGLDRRGAHDAQQQILTDVLDACRARPVLISIHSTGRTSQVVELIESRPHPGVILHWFLGASDEIARAASLGAYFSVNDAMSDELIAAIPQRRILSETDFPAKRVGARVPGETLPLEIRLGRIWGTSPEDARYQLWANLKQLTLASGAIEIISETLADRLLSF